MTDHSREKYIDSDLRDDPQLILTATRYALMYEGDFDFLRQAREQALKSSPYPLPLGVARGVLNCMRNDARWVDNLPTPAHSRPLAPVLRLVPKPLPPPKPLLLPMFVVKVRWKARWIWSDHPKAFVGHLLDPARSHALYSRPKHEIRYITEILCKTTVPSKYHRRLTQDLPETHRPCPRCSLIADRA